MKEIVEIFKNIDVFNLKEHYLVSSGEDYEFCMKIFKAWCEYIDYLFNETSFYYFLIEFDNIAIRENKIYFYSDNHDYTWHLLNFKTKTWFDLGLIRYINKTNYSELFNIEKIYES